MYDDARNARLRTLRSNPNALVRGDVVFVPDPDPRIEESATNRRATYRTIALPTRLRIRLEGRSVNDYELRVAGASIKGQVGPGGMIDEPIPGDATAAELIMKPTHLPGQEDRWTIALGTLDDISELAGVQARLDNLGFNCPPSLIRRRRFHRPRGSLTRHLQPRQRRPRRSLRRRRSRRVGISPAMQRSVSICT